MFKILQGLTLRRGSGTGPVFLSVVPDDLPPTPLSGRTVPEVQDLRARLPEGINGINLLTADQ